MATSAGLLSEMQTRVSTKIGQSVFHERVYFIPTLFPLHSDLLARMRNLSLLVITPAAVKAKT